MWYELLEILSSYISTLPTPVNYLLTPIKQYVFVTSSGLARKVRVG